ALEPCNRTVVPYRRGLRGPDRRRRPDRTARRSRFLRPRRLPAGDHTGDFGARALRFPERGSAAVVVASMRAQGPGRRRFRDARGNRASTRLSPSSESLRARHRRLVRTRAARRIGRRRTHGAVRPKHTAHRAQGNRDCAGARSGREHFERIGAGGLLMKWAWGVGPGAWARKETLVPTEDEQTAIAGRQPLRPSSISSPSPKPQASSPQIAMSTAAAPPPDRSPYRPAPALIAPL